MKKLIDEITSQSFITGFLVCLIGYSSSALIVFEAARKFGLSTTQASSWLGVLCLAMGILTISFSLKLRMPILFAWSTPGAVILLNSSPDISSNSVVGAIIASSILIAIFGASGLFEKVITKIPASMAHAMLAGVLFKFALSIFTSLETRFSLSLVMLVTFLVSKRIVPKFSILIVMIVGIIYSYFFGLLNMLPIDFSIIRPIFIEPKFELSSIIGIGIPLFIVTMTSQNLTGLAVLKSFDFHPPASKIVFTSGVVNFVISFFGGFAINLAAITAAIAMGPDTHIPHKNRYSSAVVSGSLYIFMGLFCTAFGSLFSMFPKEMIAVLTGAALFNTITASLVHIGSHTDQKDSAMLVFFITASGLVLFGIGSAFWGILVGSLYYMFSKKESAHA